MKKLHFVLTLALALGLLMGLGTGTTVSAALRQAQDAAYPGKKIQIPSINVEDGWSTWIHAQNVGDDDTGAVVFFWREYSEQCPPNSPGPAAVMCQTIVQHGVWTLRSAIPTEAKAAIIYSVDKDVFDDACREAVDAIGDDPPPGLSGKLPIRAAGSPWRQLLCALAPTALPATTLASLRPWRGSIPMGTMLSFLRKSTRARTPSFPFRIQADTASPSGSSTEKATPVSSSTLSTSRRWRQARLCT